MQALNLTPAQKKKLLRKHLTKDSSDITTVLQNANDIAPKLTDATIEKIVDFAHKKGYLTVSDQTSSFGAIQMKQLVVTNLPKVLQKQVEADLKEFETLSPTMQTIRATCGV